MAGDVLLVRPSVGGIGVDLGELWRRIKRKGPDPVEQVAVRFVELFDAHGVEVTQIPRLIPEITLAQLASPKDLLAGLTGSVLHKACVLFGIRREWLEGQGDVIYDCGYCYKSPERFFAELKQLSSPATIAPVRAVATVDSLDYRSSAVQRVELVMVETAAWIGDQEIERFRVFTDGWDWRYPECRIQLKAMIRAYREPVPLYTVTPKEIEAWYAGEVVPRALMRGALCTSPSLEDYCMSMQENRQAKEIEELEAVMRFQSQRLLMGA
jgi:hypothetical protein